MSFKLKRDLREIDLNVPLLNAWHIFRHKDKNFDGEVRKSVGHGTRTLQSCDLLHQSEVFVAFTVLCTTNGRVRKTVSRT